MKIYVGNLPFSMREEELNDLFEPHGEIVSVTIIKDRNTGRSRGFGFVEMNDDDAAKKAIETMAGQEIGGRELVVSEARAREDRGRGGRGGGGYNRGGGRGFGGGGGGGGRGRR